MQSCCMNTHTENPSPGRRWHTAPVAVAWWPSVPKQCSNKGAHHRRSAERTQKPPLAQTVLAVGVSPSSRDASPTSGATRGERRQAAEVLKVNTRAEPSSAQILGGFPLLVGFGDNCRIDLVVILVVIIAVMRVTIAVAVVIVVVLVIIVVVLVILLSPSDHRCRQSITRQMTRHHLVVNENLSLSIRTSRLSSLRTRGCGRPSRRAAAAAGWAARRPASRLAAAR